jgi:hypothetical protein
MLQKKTDCAIEQFERFEQFSERRGQQFYNGAAFSAVFG